MPEGEAERNKSSLRRFQDAMNTSDAHARSKAVDEFVDPDVVIRTPVPMDVTGPDALKEVFTRLHSAFPDLHVTIEDLIAEEDKVASRNTVTGTHRGEYLGLAATGKSISYKEIFIFRFAGGRIAETWGVVDVLSQLRQLGVGYGPVS